MKREEWWLFGFMIAVVSLLNINFNILRSVRNALVVADKGGSAAFIPYFELCGTFPASILLTWVLSRLMRKFSFRFIFSSTMLFFLFFFLIFAFWIYPFREVIQSLLQSRLGGLAEIASFQVIFTHWPDMIFYIMSELWKVALLSVVFWGFVNQKLSMDEAKRFYPPLMLGSSIGTIIAGPITVFCTSRFSWDVFPLAAQRWQHSLCLLTTFMVACGLLTLFAFNALFKLLLVKSQKTIEPSSQEREPFSQRLLSLSSSLRYLVRSSYLTALLIVVVAEYVSYALGELIFLETLKEMYPNPSDYCQYLGSLTFWTGILTAFSAIILTPYLLQKCRWSRNALITPALMVLMTFGFFFMIYCRKSGFFSNISLLPLIVFMGSLHFCIGRSAKYTLFDATKELAFIPLDREGQMRGKLIIDGMGSRLGRGGSSFLSLVLFFFLGGPSESALFVGILAIIFACILIPAARLIGSEFDRSTV